MSCGNDIEDTEVTARENDEITEEVDEETIAETEEISKKDIVKATEPTNEFVEPAAEDFEYNYDAALGGIKITKYIGEANKIRIPAQINGNAVKTIQLSNRKITQVELPDSFT